MMSQEAPMQPASKSEAAHANYAKPNTDATRLPCRFNRTQSKANISNLIGNDILGVSKYVSRLLQNVFLFPNFKAQKGLKPVPNEYKRDDFSFLSTRYSNLTLNWTLGIASLDMSRA